MKTVKQGTNNISISARALAEKVEEVLETIIEVHLSTEDANVLETAAIAVLATQFFVSTASVKSKCINYDTGEVKNVDPLNYEDFMEMVGAAIFRIVESSHDDIGKELARLEKEMNK